LGEFGEDNTARWLAYMYTCLYGTALQYFTLIMWFSIFELSLILSIGWPALEMMWTAYLPVAYEELRLFSLVLLV